MSENNVNTGATIEPEVEVTEMTTLEKAKQWCADHKTELIVGGIVVVSAAAVIIGIKKYKKYNKEVDDTIINLLETDRSDIGLPIADNASIVMRDKWASESLKNAGEPLDLAGKTLIQSMANVPWDWKNGVAPASDFVKVIPSNKEEMTESIIEGFQKLLETIDPETIKSINMTYDIS